MFKVKNSNNSRNLAVVWGAGIIICMMSVPGWAQYGGGSGTEIDPFLISDPNHMQAIGAHQEHWVAGTYFQLVEDIDLSRFTGTQFNIIGNETTEFNGSFNGNGHRIHNFTYLDTSAKSYVGLFGYLGSDGEIRDLGLEDPNIATAGDYVGSLVGYNEEGAVSNCYATGAVTCGDYSGILGGLVGWNSGTISDCYATGAVTGGINSRNLGGLVGQNDYGTINNCYATVSVNGGDYSRELGGLVGFNRSGTIINCHANGSVTGGYGSDLLGGLVGDNYGAISNCYARGAVTGGDYSDRLGGLVGYNLSKNISNCYASGAVTGGRNSSTTGGLVGYNRYGAISNCYATGAVTGGADSWCIGGLVGLNSEGTVSDCYWNEESSGLSFSHGGRKKTTTQMKEAQTYVGWNGGFWVIDDGNDYPHLWWEEGASGLPAITTDYPVRTYPGNGDDQPFELDSSEDLICLSWRTIDWEKNFVLAGDIDMNSVLDFYPPSDFNGHIDGAGYSVVNLTVDAHVIGNNCQLGLIGRLGNGGHIENLGVEEVNIIGGEDSQYLGSLVGLNRYGSISNCYATGAVTGGDDSYNLGGLVGENTVGTISNCYTTGAVTCGDYSGILGGLVGRNHIGTLSNCYATGAVTAGVDSDALGGLVGYTDYYSTINNCHANGAVTSGDDSLHIGGLVGRNDSQCSISNCYATGSVSGGDTSWYIGGLVGWNDGTVNNCYATGVVNGNYVSYCFGGLVGYNGAGVISNCYATGSVGGGRSHFFGGLVGDNYQGTISNCYATGAVTGGYDSGFLGGLVGGNYSSAISNCYATGAVTGGYHSDNLGGLVGGNHIGTISNCFWDTETSGMTTSDGGTGKTTAEMQQRSTYTGWDFVGEGGDDIWKICEGADYPQLWWEKYGGGIGNSASPYLIRNPCHLQAIGDHSEHWVSGTWFKLVRDIDLSRFTGTQFNIIGTYIEYNDPDNEPFNGVFDGNGHKIHNFSYSTVSAENGVGLFSYLGSEGEIRDLGLEDPNVETSGDFAGGLVGYNSGAIINCYVKGVVSGGSYLGGLAGYNKGDISICNASSLVTGGDGSENLGGLMGYNEEGAISYCYATGVVTGGDYSLNLGGLVGNNWNGTITNCYAIGSVTGVNGSYSLGGLVGETTGFITNCYATGSVTAGVDSDALGGLVGWNTEGSASNCYATGSITGGEYSTDLGGLVGINNDTISNCYSAGSVTGEVGSYWIGGLVGWNDQGSISNCFWDTQTSGLGDGFGNNNSTIINLFGKTTSLMQIQSTFTDYIWDFLGEWANGELDYWRMCVDGVEYPKLSWQFPEGDLLCPDGVGILDLFYFVSHWLEIDCDVSNNYCRRADINFSGSVDLVDFGRLGANWHKK